MSKAQKIECSVCVEATSQSKTATCPFCAFSCCKTCFIRVLTDRKDDAHCMNCKRRFDREMLIQLTSTHFVNTTYKSFREEILFEREKAMIPATIPYVQIERDGREARKAIQVLAVERDKLKRRLSEVNAEIGRQLVISNRTEPHQQSIEETRREFTQCCPRDNCHGWLNSSYRCGVCSVFSCPKCLAPCGSARADVERHVCLPEDVESVKMIRSNSVPCPSCGIRISKVSGCSQMWCVQCHCAFDYRTGSRINGQIHNPHWFIYQQQNTQTLLRDPRDIPCGGLPNVHELRQCVTETTRAKYLCEALRMVLHIEQVELPTLNQRADIINRNWRVRYIMGEVGEDAFKTRIQRSDKIDSKKFEISQVFQMLVQTITDELRQLVTKEKCAKDAEKSVTCLINYANAALGDIAHRYSQVTPRIWIPDETFGAWRIVHRK